MSKILYTIIDDLLAREDKGLKEYGTTMDRTDLTEIDWLQHAYEEALDLSIYLKKLINNMIYNDDVECIDIRIPDYPDWDRTIRNINEMFLDYI